MLLVYLSAWLKPYFPYLEYEVNKEHIAKNLCENKAKPEMKCNGKCHRAKQIQKIAQEEVPTKEQPAPQTKVESKEILFFVPSLNSNLDLKANFNSQKISTEYINLYCSVYLEESTPPPKFIG